MPLPSLTLFFILSFSLQVQIPSRLALSPPSPSSFSPLFLAISLHLLNLHRPLSFLSSFLSPLSPQISATLSLCLLKLAPTSLFFLSFPSFSPLFSTLSFLPKSVALSSSPMLGVLWVLGSYQRQWFGVFSRWCFRFGGFMTILVNFG